MGVQEQMTLRENMPGLSNFSKGSLDGVSIPNVLLKTMLRDEGLLNFCHLNVASVKPKIDELRKVFNDVNAHVISFSETWLKSYDTNSSVEMEGFKFFRSDRRKRKSGGVAAYVRSDMKCKVLASSRDKYDMPRKQLYVMDY